MKKVLVALLMMLTAACAQLSQSSAGGSAPQSFSYPQNGLNGAF